VSSRRMVFSWGVKPAVLMAAGMRIPPVGDAREQEVSID